MTVNLYEIREKVDDCLGLAEREFKRSFKYELIKINIRGRAAGLIHFDHSIGTRRLPILRFNPVMLMRYGSDFVDQVVPHECAHLVAFELYGFKIKPHGSEWKAIMRNLYQCEPSVTHRFEVPESKRRSRPYAYECCCDNKVHQLSAIRHNRVMRLQAQYLCRDCRSKLRRIAK